MESLICRANTGTNKELTLTKSKLTNLFMCGYQPHFRLFFETFMNDVMENTR